MGDFRVLVEAVGGHGCERQFGDGETVIGCERPGCPDCTAREFVRRLKRAGNTVKVAQIQHWPADLPGYTEAGEVRDNLLTGVRSGEFPERDRYLGPATFTVNGESCTMASRTVSYDEIANLAGMDAARHPTVVYRRAAGQKPEGTLAPGETVKVTKDTVINCAVTGSA